MVPWPALPETMRPARAALVSAALLATLAPAAAADTVVAARTIRATEVIAAQDLVLVAGTVPGGFSDPAALVGLEAQVALYAGRPIRAGDVGPPALVERNQIVTLIYRHGGLQITTDGRSLGRGGLGDVVRVMNLASRGTVSAVVGPEGWLHVTGTARPFH